MGIFLLPIQTCFNRKLHVFLHYMAMLSLSQLDLPITEIIPEVKQQLTARNTILIQAPPGAGKSTLLPLSLLQEPWLEGKKILLLEPRRLATKSIAQRMSDLLGEEVGQTVGYRIRFDTCVSANTRLEVITEGILTRMLHQDNALEDVGMVIFDEFHERNLFSEVGLALCREVQQILREDLRILLMSATIDSPQLSKLLDAPIIQSKGRQYPVAINYLQEVDEYSIGEDSARQLIPLTKQHAGDFLVFLPGQGDIRKAEEVLKKALATDLIVPLYGQLSFRSSNGPFFPTPMESERLCLPPISLKPPLPLRELP